MIERLLHLFERYPIDLISYLSSCLPIVVGLVRFQNMKLNVKYVWGFFVFFFIKDTYSLIHMFFIPNTLYIQNLEVIAESIIIGIIYFYEFEKPVQKKITLMLTIAVTLVSVYSYSSVNVSSVSLSVFRFFLIILSLSYFNNVLSDMRVSNITKYSLFWFSSGLLIYSTGTFFIVLFSEYWYKGVDKVSAEVFDKYWNASQILFIIFCLFSALGLWFSKYDKENFIQ